MSAPCATAPKPPTAPPDPAHPSPAPPTPPAAAPAQTRSFIIFFDWNSATLTERARQIIADAAQHVRAQRTTRIEVFVLGVQQVEQGALADLLLLADAVERGVLVKHPFDRHFGRRVAGKRRQEDAPKRIPQRVTETALERLHHHLGVHWRQTLYVNDSRFQ